MENEYKRGYKKGYKEAYDPNFTLGVIIGTSIFWIIIIAFVIYIWVQNYTDCNDVCKESLQTYIDNIGQVEINQKEMDMAKQLLQVKSDLNKSTSSYKSDNKGNREKSERGRNKSERRGEKSERRGEKPERKRSRSNDGKFRRKK